MLKIVYDILKIDDFSSLVLNLKVKIIDDFLQLDLIMVPILNGGFKCRDFLVEFFGVGHEITDLIFEQLTHFIMQLLLVLDLPFEIFDLKKMLLFS